MTVRHRARGGGGSCLTFVRLLATDNDIAFQELAFHYESFVLATLSDRAGSVFGPF